MASALLWPKIKELSFYSGTRSACGRSEFLFSREGVVEGSIFFFVKMRLSRFAERDKREI